VLAPSIQRDLNSLNNIGQSEGKMKRTIGKLCSDRSGNFGMLFGLCLVPLVGMSGAAIDFGYAYSIHQEIQNSADTAVVAALSEQAIGVVTGINNDINGTVKVAQKDAKALFQAQMSEQTKSLIDKVSLTVKRKKGVFTATLTYKANVPTTLMGVLGWKQIPISGTATSQYDGATYMDFYMLLDNTPSMGVGATTTDISTMEKNTSDSCAFACHDMSNSNSYYNLAKKLGVQTRIDVVRQATQNLTTTADETKRYANQFRMAVYTFGSKAEAAGLTKVADLSSNMSKVRKDADAVDLMTIPYQNYNGDQQTSIDTAMTKIAVDMGKGGDGSSASSPEKILFFVSDGVGDSYKPSTCTQPTTNGRCQEPIDISFCKPLKDAGIKIAVLYTTYLPLPKNGWYNTWIKPFQSKISTEMKSCASDGLFFEVSPTEGISDAMKALFQKVINYPKLTG
jgi:Flp pilus assembly protein TadG